jgi:oligoribonuclease
MRYLSVDLETTGLDPSFCQILEIGAVVDDTDWPDLSEPEDDNYDNYRYGGRPSFHCYVLHDKIVGQAFALNMNAQIIERIAHYKEFPNYNFFTPIEAMEAFGDFIAEHFPQKDYKKVTVAGKNFASFDRNFLARMPDSDLVLNRLHRRVMDRQFCTSRKVIPNFQTFRRVWIGRKSTARYFITPVRTPIR